MTEHAGDKKCRVCGDVGPMIFANEDWCSDWHRKVISKEKDPTVQELSTMDRDLFMELHPEGQEISLLREQIDALAIEVRDDQTVGSEDKPCACDNVSDGKAHLWDPAGGCPTPRFWPGEREPEPDLHDYNNFGAKTYWRGPLRYVQHEGIELVWDNDENKWVPNA